jgi:hypothetical protein
MFTIHHSRTTIFAFATVLTLALSAPSAVIAQDQVIADEQVLAAEEQTPVLAPAVPSWDETSGYGAVEASRATIGHDAVRGFGGTGHEASAAMGRSWDALSGYGSVEASRAAVSTMLSGEGISDQEQALAFAAAAAATLWDATSGYGSVEASRAANALPAASTTFTSQVSPDVRWAPAPAIAPVPEDALRAVVDAVIAWDETSGYGAVEATRATASALLAPDAGPAWLAASRTAAARQAAPAFPAWNAARWSPVEPGPATNPDYIPAALASGQRAEIAHLATVLLLGEDAGDVALAAC